MRRGKLNKKSILLIIVVAIFTLFSYITDQLVIRTEDKIRNLNIDFNNAVSKVKKYDTEHWAIVNLQVSIENTVYFIVNKRNIWIKSFLLLNQPKQEDNVFVNNFSKNQAKKNILIQLDNVLDSISTISLEFAIMVDNEVENIKNEKFMSLVNFNKNNDDLVDLFQYRGNIISSYPDEFYYGEEIEKLFYDEVWLKFKLEEANPDKNKAKDILDDMSINFLLDVHRYTMILTEMLHLDAEKLDSISDYYLDLNMEFSEKRDNLLVAQRKNYAKKNYYILASILFQILSLLFLLLLFKNFMLIKKY